MNDPHAHIQQKQLHPLPHPVEAVVITVSDRCASGEREDTSGPLAAKLLQDHGIDVITTKVVADGIESVQTALKESFSTSARLVFTTGGTGITERDLTPEATAPLLAVQLPGIAQQITLKGLESTPLAGLSRALVGVTERTPAGVVVVNAPGSHGGVKDSISIIGPLLPHLLEQIDPLHFGQ